MISLILSLLRRVCNFILFLIDVDWDSRFSRVERDASAFARIPSFLLKPIKSWILTIFENCFLCSTIPSYIVVDNFWLVGNSGLLVKNFRSFINVLARFS